MRRDVNQSILTGRVSTKPTLVNLRSGKKICLFTLLCLEHYEYASGAPGSHENYITIEVVGQKACDIPTQLSIGDPCLITGYLRVDDINGVEKIRVRALNIQKDIHGEQ
jgi:single-stranded DNA-binding protein